MCRVRLLLDLAPQLLSVVAGVGKVLEGLQVVALVGGGVVVLNIVNLLALINKSGLLFEQSRE